MNLLHIDYISIGLILNLNMEMTTFGYEKISKVKKGRKKHLHIWMSGIL